MLSNDTNLTKTIANTLTVEKEDSVIRKNRITDNTHLSTSLMEAMKDFTCAITQFRVESNIINNDADSIKNDLIEGLLDTAGTVSRCVSNVAPVVISIEEDIE